MLFWCLGGPELSQELAAVTNWLLCPPHSHSKQHSHIRMHRRICSLTSQHDDSWKHQCKWQLLIPEIFTSQHGTHEKCGLYATVKLNVRPLYTWQNTVNSPSQSQGKLPGNCHITQIRSFPTFHRSDGSSFVNSLIKTDSVGLQWVGALESSPPSTCIQAFHQLLTDTLPALLRTSFCPTAWLHITTEPNPLWSCDECQAWQFPLLC